jgi:hypothetical protein
VSNADCGFGKVEKSVKYSEWDLSFIDIEIDHAINQQEHPFLVAQVVEARALAEGSVSVRLAPSTLARQTTATHSVNSISTRIDLCIRPSTCPLFCSSCRPVWPT